MKKGLILFWTNVLNLLLMLGLVGTGIILRWVLPPGSGGGGPGRGIGWRGGQGPRVVAEWLGLTRHQWGDIHCYLAIALAAGITLHLLLHTGYIRSACARWLVPRGLSRRQTSQALQT